VTLSSAHTDAEVDGLLEALHSTLGRLRNSTPRGAA
jgi:hypothetical protein